jgi:hypothetical protein
LDYLVAHASGCNVARAAGVQSEMELAFAGLQQLCAAMLGRLECLPAPQRDALETAFGLRHGDRPDRFLIGLAVLSLFSEVAAEQPLVCVVDDVQWLDRASAQALEFVARRLFAESVGLVFAIRQAGDEPPLAVLPELLIEGLNDERRRDQGDAGRESAECVAELACVQQLIAACRSGDPHFSAAMPVPRARRYRGSRTRDWRRAGASMSQP